MNKQTGLIEEKGKLDELKIIVTTRSNGFPRVQFDYSNCVSLTEQHSARDTDINYLIKKHTPDELSMYLSARAQRIPIEGYDETVEPSLQEAMNIRLGYQQAYDRLPEDLKRQFPSYVSWLKFIDNPQNIDKLVSMGYLKKHEPEHLSTDTTEEPQQQNKKTKQKQKTQKTDAPKSNDESNDES